MKYFIFFLFLNSFVFSQEKDLNLKNKMTKSLPDYEVISYNCMHLIMDYYPNKIDSALKVLEYWEKKCTINEAIFRTKILLNLAKNQFSENIYNKSVVDYALLYKERVDFLEEAQFFLIYQEAKGYFGFVPIGGEYDIFTKNIANEVSKNISKDSISYAFCYLYQNKVDSFFIHLQNEKFKNSKLRKFYNKKTDKINIYPKGNIAFHFGQWIPTDNLKLFGNHTSLGFQIGIEGEKNVLLLAGDFGIAQSKESYNVIYEDSLINVDNFFNVYVGMEYKRRILKIKNNILFLDFGIAYDGIRVVKNTTKYVDEKNNAKWTECLNLNTGLTYRYNFANNFYIGFSGRYNFVEYFNKNGTNLEGNSFTMNILFGSFIW